MRIVLIGSGNVATVLGRRLLAAGHVIVQVYSRNPLHAAVLASELGALPVSTIPAIAKDADIHILAIADDELYALKDWLFTAGRLAVHTAGSVSKDVLKDIAADYGVFYPLQTLRRETEVMYDIPFLIDGNTEDTRQELFTLARSISDNVQYADDTARKKLHLAAVMVNNFSNHLYALTEAYCKSEGADFKMLQPLISEGALRIRHYSPAQLQTGPAIRNDNITIGKHRELLQRYPALLKIYDQFTDSIRKNK